MTLIRLVALFACVFTSHLALAADTNNMSPAAAHAIYDPSEWTLVRSTSAHFGKTLTNAEVMLLKSVQATGSSGSGEPLYTVNLVVAAAGKVIYSFAPLVVPPRDDRRYDPVFYMDDGLEVRDVTNDDVPEIVFRSGFLGVSDRGIYTHILQVTKAVPIRFRDIAAKSFLDSWWHGVRLLDLNGRTVAIVAEPVDPPLAPGDFVSHGQPRFHRYVVYAWDQRRERFIQQQRIAATRQLHQSAQEGLETDWAYIAATVKKHHPR